MNFLTVKKNFFYSEQYKFYKIGFQRVNGRQTVDYQHSGIFVYFRCGHFVFPVRNARVHGIFGGEIFCHAGIGLQAGVQVLHAADVYVSAHGFLARFCQYAVAFLHQTDIGNAFEQPSAFSGLSARRTLRRIALCFEL